MTRIPLTELRALKAQCLSAPLDALLWRRLAVWALEILEAIATQAREAKP